MAGEGSSYQGGAGGKFRKKPFKKPQSTPYERPPTALRNPSWVAKLIVDPATKLVAAGANLFFSSVYRKRLGAPPPHPSPSPQGANQESRERFLETVKPHPFGDQGQTSNDNGKQVLPGDLGLNMMVNSKQTKSSENGGLSELEIMLKQKTFTRSEIDRLTELLHSRTVELSNGTEEKCTKLHPQETGSALRGSDNFARNSLHETRNGSHLNKHRYDGHVSTAVVGSKDFEEDFKTPVELAKDFMSNSSSKMPPSVLSLRSQAMREGPGALSNSPFAQRSPAMSLIQKPASHAGVFENGYATPKSRGRSAIYNMARTPYSRLPTASITDNHYIYDGSGGPSASSPNGFARELVARSVSKDMALKRRSSVLDDEIGSVGPIRRLRQKTNLSTPSNMVKTRPFSSSETEIVPNGCLDPSSSSKALQKSEDNERMPGTRHTPVPPQSKEAARKILQQLQMVSPKEKQLEGRASGLIEKLPSKLTPDMLNKQALRSLQDADSPNILHDAGYSLNYKQKTPLLDTCETSSQRQDKKVAKNGAKSVNVFYAGKSNGIISSEDTVPASSVSDSAKKQNTTLSTPKKRGFQMSAHEDFFELDDEIPSSEAAVSTKLAEEKKTLETPGPSSILIPVIEDKITTGSEFKAPAVPSEFGKLTNLETSDVTKVVERNSGFTFSATPAVSSSFLPVVSVSQATNFAKDVPDQEPNVPSHSSSSAVKTDDINAPFSFSSPPFVGGSVEQSTTPPAEVKQETTASLTADASGTTRTVPKPAEFDNDGFRNKQKPGDAVGKLDNSSSLPQPTSNLFSVSSNPSFSNSKDHSLKSTAPSIPSWPTPTNSTSNLNPFTGFGFSTSSSSVPSVETSTSISSLPSSILAPAYKFGSTSNGTPSTTTITTPTATPFQFGSTSISTSSATTSLMPSLNTTTDFKSGSLSMAPSTYSTVSTTSIASDVKAKTEKEPNLGKLPGNPFGATSFPSASSGSSIFGFSAGSTSSSAASPSQGSMLGTSNVPAVSTQSLPVLGSSASSSILGISGSTTFATGSALFPSNPSSSSFGNTTSSSSIFGNNNISSSYPLTSSASSNSMFGLATTSNINSSSSFGQATSAPSSTGFVFGEKPSQTPIFGSSTSASSTSSIFPFNSAPQSQPAFGNSPVPAFSSLPGGNNGDQMTMAEDSMAEDQVQAGPTPTPPFPIIFGGPQVQNTSPNPVPVFGQPQVQNTSPNPFMFGQTPSSATGAAPFQFGGQQNQPIAQNPNPFQPSGNSLDFGGGGGSSFSLGSGGDDKSGRRMIRVKHKGRRK